MQLNLFRVQPTPKRISLFSEINIVKGSEELLRKTNRLLKCFPVISTTLLSLLCS